jgi:hypothetical protein
MKSLNPIGPESVSLNCLTRPGTETKKLDKKKTNTNQNLNQNLGNKDRPNTTQTERRNTGTTKPNKNDLQPPNQQQ